MDKGPDLIIQKLLCSRILLKYEKETEKASDTVMRRGMESAPFTSP